MGTLEQALVELVTMVDRPIINCLSMIKYLFISSSYVLHFEWFNVMGALPQALEIIFEVQRKTNNEKTNKKKNKHFNLQNVFFLVPFSLDPSYLQTS